MSDISEQEACTPVQVKDECFNDNCELPYDLTTDHIKSAMEDFVSFIGFINEQIHSQGIQRLESFLMPANFSSIVGEFMNMSIPKYCDSLVKNQYHNGHPDLIPKGKFEDNAVQYTSEGIEIKGSRRLGSWQGHNPESVWLMVFHFDSNTSNDKNKDIGPKKFQFKGVFAANLNEDDWNYSGRSDTSRRTITATVNAQGRDKMKDNWIYDDLG